MKTSQHRILYALFLLLLNQLTNGQFLDHFDSTEIHPDWMCFGGDGEFEIDFKQGPQYASINLDATNDEMNVWWGIIKRHIKNLDQEKLVHSDYELRVESRIKVSHAPRRVNMSFNHQRTSDFHSYLMEFDIADTSNWHIISMTTKGFNVKPDDNIHVQLALMDWGLRKFQVQVDYMKVDVVDPSTSGPDLGNPQSYHPPIPPIASFAHKLMIKEDVAINKQFSRKNFHRWTDPLQQEVTNLLPVSHDQMILLKFDTEKFNHVTPRGVSVLAMHLHHLERSQTFDKDFGIVRLIEILGGDENWKQAYVTYESFFLGKPYDEVLNQQTIIDVDLTQHKNRTICFTLSEAVMKRLLNGRTKGLALFPLGAVLASFYGSENIDLQPIIYFNKK